MNKTEHDEIMRYMRELFEQNFEKNINGEFVGKNDVRIRIEEMPIHFLSEVLVFTEEINGNGSSVKKFYCKLQLRYNGRENSVFVCVLVSKDRKNESIEYFQKVIGEEKKHSPDFHSSEARRIILALTEIFGEKEVSTKK